MSRPTIFKLSDIPALLIPTLACTLATAAAFFYTNRVEAHVVGCLASLGFIIISVLQLKTRWDFVKNYTCEVFPNVWVSLNTYKVSPDVLTATVRLLVLTYSRRFPNAGELLSRSTVFVEFIPSIMTLCNQGTVAGWTSGQLVKVSYARRLPDNSSIPWLTAPIAATAFAHELSHIIIGRGLGDWNDATSHALMQKIENGEA